MRIISHRPQIKPLSTRGQTPQTTKAPSFLRHAPAPDTPNERRVVIRNLSRLAPIQQGVLTDLLRVVVKEGEGQIRAVVGNLAQTEALLKQADAHAATQSVFQKFGLLLNEPYLAHDPIVSRTRRFLTNPQFHDVNRVCVLVTENGTSLKGKPACHASTVNGFNRRKDDDQDRYSAGHQPEEQPTEARSSGTAHLHESFQILVLDSHRDHPAAFALDFFHEATHAADVPFVRDWLEANHTLFCLGKPTDAFFSGWAGVDEHGPWIHDGCWRVLTEARAHYIEMLPFFLNPKVTNREMFLRESLSTAMRNIRSYPTVNPTVLERLGINDGNLFDWGLAVTKLMEETLVRASQQAG